jgi:hypothetical protein
MAGVNWEEVVLFLMDCELANSLKLPLVRVLDPISHFVTQTYPPIAGNLIVCTVFISIQRASHNKTVTFSTHFIK